ncbi:hypothetical protein CXB51_028754 [Gossypium anomalum]|uniref:DUF6821 domain-containing protein n=1 Tax=Gossypium anomalum TaxID=47600 RepID=A0A8J6CL15_9ROSI|nr:hypothetical protein CXB51_028754 [Gossypium anomalum]
MIHQEMDIDHEWVFLPDNRFLDINQDHGGKRVSDSNLVFFTDYFDEEQSPPSGNSGKVAKQVVPVPFPLEPRILKVPENEIGKEITKRVPLDFSSTPSMILEKIKEAGMESVGGDKEVKTQVSFRKPSYNNNESVDMTNKWTHQGPLRKELSLNWMLQKAENKDVNWEESSSGLNLWKWSLTGIGAICSLAQTTTTEPKNCCSNVTVMTRMKQVVHHTTKLNEAISVVRGVPITRAQITFGGYYDATYNRCLHPWHMQA